VVNGLVLKKKESGDVIFKNNLNEKGLYKNKK
jgi:hypothetical protein